MVDGEAAFHGRKQVLRIVDFVGLDVCFLRVAVRCLDGS
jgi:hypothetical protein